MRPHRNRYGRFARVQGRREDLDEMLGNLLDNACKWARTQAGLTSSKEGQQIVIAVDDDGPGIEPAMRAAVMQRGVRADESAYGSGLGLAIVRDLAEIYGGSLSLEGSPMGGIRARLTLPTQDVVWRRPCGRHGHRVTHLTPRMESRACCSF